MSLDYVEIVHNIRQQLSQSAGKTAALERAFQCNGDGSGKFNFEDFEAILSKVGIFLKRQDLTNLYRQFDEGQQEQLDSATFVSAIKGDMNDRRKAVVKAAWDKLGGGDSITAQALWDGFDADGHPDVATGAKTGDRISREFQTAMAHAGLPSDGDSPISWTQFQALYATISAGHPYDDDWFSAIVCGTYRVELASDDSPAEHLLWNVERTLWEKVRQKTKATGQVSETLRLSLQQLDLEDLGYLDQSKFVAGLERFGIVLQPSIASALFAKHANDGVVNIAGFAQSVCAAAAC